MFLTHSIIIIVVIIIGFCRYAISRPLDHVQAKIDETMADSDQSLPLVAIHVRTGWADEMAADGGKDWKNNAPGDNPSESSSAAWKDLRCDDVEDDYFASAGETIQTASKPQMITSLVLFNMAPQTVIEMCFASIPAPYVPGAGCKTRLGSGIKEVFTKRLLFMFGFQNNGQNLQSVLATVADIADKVFDVGKWRLFIASDAPGIKSYSQAVLGERVSGRILSTMGAIGYHTTLRRSVCIAIFTPTFYIIEG